MTENVRFEQSGVMLEWDPAKAESNETKHKVTFPDAVSCWHDPYRISREDEPHSWDETRIKLIGFSRKAELLLVCHAYREESGAIRIISARKATRQEVAFYEDGGFPDARRNRCR